MIDEKKITVVDEKGNEHIMQILFTYDNEERKTSYVFLYDEAWLSGCGQDLPDPLLQ